MAEYRGISDRVVSRVAERESVSEDALPQLYDAIEPDALEELFKHGNTKPNAELKVQFSYAGYVITVRGPEDISIEE